jgi:hypothetical protein
MAGYPLQQTLNARGGDPRSARRAVRSASLRVKVGLCFGLLTGHTAFPTRTAAPAVSCAATPTTSAASTPMAIDTDGHGVVRRSAARDAAWVRRDYDHLT